MQNMTCINCLEDTIFFSNAFDKDPKQSYSVSVAREDVVNASEEPTNMCCLNWKRDVT